jgi:glycopeptide antibiotics resistance protein
MRRGAIIVGLSYTGYVVVATLYPFELSRNASHGFSQRFFGGFNAPDFILNVLLFIPLGILLYYGLVLNRAKPWTILLTSLFAAAISLGIELLQFYFSRNPSGFDVLFNTVGAGCGALGSALLPSRCFDLAVRVVSTTARSRSAVAVAVLVGAAPLLLSFVQLFQPFGVWNSRFTFQIGNEATLDRPWVGEVYVVALYNRALSANEIRDNFLEGSAAKTRSLEGLVSLYTFSEGQGPVVYDRSGVEPQLNLIIAPEDHVRWHHSAKGIEIIKPAIVRSSKPATKLIQAARASNELSIEVWLTTGQTMQTGPARIVSFSADTGARNFTLGQDGSVVEFRLRTPISGRNGTPLAVKSTDKISGLEKSHLVATYKNGVETLYLNGRQQADVLDLTKDGIIGFGTRKTALAAAAYSFFYFFPVSFLCATFLSRRANGLMSRLLPFALGAGLCAVNEVFQMIVFARGADFSVIFWSLFMAALGTFSGQAFCLPERRKTFPQR